MTARRRVHSPHPLLDGLWRHVAHFRSPGAHLGRRSVAVERRLPEHHRRHDPGARRQGRLDELRDPALVDHLHHGADVLQTRRLRRLSLLGHQRLDVVVEVVDRHLPRLERVEQPDPVGDMATERKPDLVRRGGHGVEHIEGQILVHLQEVVADLLVLAHQLLRLLRCRDPRPVQRRAAQK